MSQTKKQFVLCPLVCAIVLMCAAASALAQSTKPEEFPKLEIFAGYSALGENQKPSVAPSSTLRLSNFSFDLRKGLLC